VTENLILLVEDDEDDVFFMRRAMKDAGLGNRLEVLRNGEEAIHYLSGENGFSDRTRYPLPQFIFLDLKMPLANGFDVLQWLKRQPALDIPVAVLSSSPEDKDMKRSRELGAACYLIKPPTPQMLHSCWLQFSLKR
jgi:CheY-like chemotaxis protein